MRFLILLVTIAYFALAAASFDYVIVGGGATGLALAVRLSEDSSKSVVVLEAGGTGFGNVNITNLRLSRSNFGTPEDWQFVAVPQTHGGNRVQAQAQGRVLGGGSAINSGMYTRGNEIEYDALETLGAKGWNWKSMFAAVKKSERFFPPSTPDVQVLNVTFDPAFHGIAGPVALSLQALNISRLFPAVVVPTLRALGFEMNFDSNGGRHNGPSWNYLTVLPDTSTRSHAVSGYYLPVASPLDNPGGSKVATLNGANIILSASTLNTPKILELSGVGDPNVLRSIGIDVQIDLQGVGANLCNQPMSTGTSFLMRNGTVDVGNAIRSAILDFLSRSLRS
ncbi:putative GMC oxidoreductase [Lyophyllum shimeji]|uniref:GMC oxidoreductase n=1 Tax=Lyophyllum shimeji TaxID=47721 RepID=A0A9P3PLN6_LYOSH|nr:putative GMC oxidoreductase [Lyophyllum shimeji]